MTSFQPLYRDICNWAAVHGIQVHEKSLPSNTAGEFTGTDVRMNRQFGWEERSYYLIHAIGSIVCWSLDEPGVRHLLHRLRAAKENKNANVAELEWCIEQYRAFETLSSEFAVWLLAKRGYGDIKPLYTNFMRADLEAMTEFHRIGTAPVWRTYFANWNGEVASGQRQVAAFEPKVIPPFEPKQIEKQEILQPQEDSAKR